MMPETELVAPADDDAELAAAYAMSLGRPAAVEGIPVYLAVYDISKGWAKWLSRLLLWRRIDYAPHTGIIIYGNEYFWSGGLQKSTHEEFMNSWKVEPIELFELGRTSIPEEAFMDFLMGVTTRYTERTYDLLSNNCNNFTNESAQFLLGHGIPSRILDVPEMFKRSLLGRCLLALGALSHSALATGVALLQLALAVGGLSALAATAHGGCPVSPASDTSVQFAVATFAMELAFTLWLLTALLCATRLGVVIPTPPRAAEVFCTA
jgi:hypothetical protein